MLHCVANVGKLAIFKNEEVVLLSQRLQLLAEGRCVVLIADIRVTLDYSSWQYSRRQIRIGLTQTFRMSTCVFSTQMLGPRESASWRSSSLLVTSADTHRFDCFSSMIFSSLDARGWTSAEERRERRDEWHRLIKCFKISVTPYMKVCSYRSDTNGHFARAVRLHTW